MDSGPVGAEDALGEALRHVYWLGGGSGAGKSTLARRLAERYGMRVYDTDEAMSDHAGRTPPEDAPLLARFAAMSPDERWVTRTPGEMLDTFHWFSGEGFDRIIDDLRRLPSDRPVIAEGFRLLPGLVRPLLDDPRSALWLLPTPDFRRAVLDSRGGSGWAFLARTSDPERALDNLLQRDAMFTERLADDVARLGLAAIPVDGTGSEAELEQEVATAFGLDR